MRAHGDGSNSKVAELAIYGQTNRIVIDKFKTVTINGLFQGDKYSWTVKTFILNLLLI